MTVTNSPSRLWIKASPRGTRSGFAVLPDGEGGRVTVTILPKPWSSEPQSVQDYLHQPGKTTHIVTHETELIAISTSRAASGSLAISLADSARKQTDLLALGSPADDLLCDPVDNGDPFGHLIDLMLLAERGSLMNSPLRFEGTLAPSLLRLLSHERLLRVVEELIFRARPRYTELTETLATPRGRLHEKSLLFSIETGTPRVQSTFDELSTDTPLLQIMAAALRVISRDHLPQKIVALRPGLQARAVHLLQLLAGVTPIDRERAVLAAERLWLGPLDQIWKPALDAALPVLRDWAVVPATGSESAESVLVQIPTEKFWERCLELALRVTFSGLAVNRDGHVAEGVSVPAPWVPHTAPKTTDKSEQKPESYPDFLLRFGSQVVVADAKYKLRAGGVSSSDAYQLFAYSHLATLGGQAADLAAILYPVRSSGRPEQWELERMRGRRYSLWLAHLPFPRPTDLRSQQNWSIYIASLAGHLQSFAKDWT